jgi:hypothetical protein
MPVYRRIQGATDDNGRAFPGTVYHVWTEEGYHAGTVRVRHVIGAPRTTWASGWQYRVNGEPWSPAVYANRREATAALFRVQGLEEQVPTRRTRRPRSRSGRSEGRVFGIEMELTGPAPETIIDALTAAGIRMAQQNIERHGAIPYSHTNTEQNVWTLKSDGSVNGYGLELVSPKLSGEAGFEMIRTVCRVLNEIGASVDTTCGLHVHHDFRNMSVAEIRTQILMFLERQSAIMRLVAPSRRRNSYCRTWSQRDIEEVLGSTNSYSLSRVGPRGALNLGSLGLHGSVEIRCHGGTTNADKIIAWVRFGQALFAAGAAGAQVATEPEAMLMDLLAFGLTTEDAAILLRFENIGVDRAAIEARIATLRQQLAETEDLLREVAAVA